MKSNLSYIVNSIFIACCISIVAYFFTYDTCQEIFIHQKKTEIVLKFYAEEDMNLSIHLNHISEVLNERVSSHSFSAGDQILRIPLSRNFDIEQIYFTSTPIGAKFEISEISFHSSLTSHFWTKDALVEIIEPFNPQNIAKETMIFTENKTLQFSLNRALPFGIIKGKFSNTIYKSIRSKLFLISLSALLIVFAIGLYFILKSRIVENVPRNALFFSFIFILLITVPFFSQKDNYTLEKRVLAKFPDLDQLIWNIPKKYTKYFNDHFPFRTQLSKMNNLIKIRLFNTSPMPEQVRIGKEGWIFNYMQMTRDKYMGEVLYTEEELAHIQFNLEEKEAWLATQGSKFYLILLPLKHDMYPEYLPTSMVPRININQRTQVLDYLKKNSQINLIDGYEVLMKKKDSVRLYYKTDLHWNQLGGFFTYIALMKTLKKDFPELKPKTSGDYSIKQKFDDYSGDLLGIMNTDTFFCRDPFFLTLKSDLTATLFSDGPVLPEESDYTYYENDKAPEIRLLVFRDSFFSYLIPHLSENFSFSAYSWHTAILPERVNKIDPDIVVQEVMQIFLDELLKDNPDVMKKNTSKD